MNYSQKQLEALRAVCNCFIPSISGDAYWRRNAADWHTAERIIRQIDKLTLREQKEFQQLLSLLTNPLVGLTWGGPLKSVNKLSETQINKLFRKWSTHRLKNIRKGYNTLKKLSGLIYFGDNDKGLNPNWEALKYKLPGPFEGKQSTLDKGIIDVSANQTFECDVVIVGSGAGGGLAAAVLSAAGYRVIVVEKGQYYRNEACNQLELEMFNRLYEGRGLLTTVDGSVSVLAGSCLGGGTTVNWAGAFRTPDYILEEWAKEHDNPHFLSTEYREGFDFVEKRNAIRADFMDHNPQNETLFKGARKLGWNVQAIPMNIRKPEGLPEELFWKSQGFSPLGDIYGSKQSSLTSFLPDAVGQNAQILFATTVERVIHEHKIVRGLKAFTIQNGQRIEIDIRARRVIIAAGSIHSPAILKRSGLRHPEIGKNLYLHPTVPVAAVYNKESNPWYGPMMSTVVDEFTRLDGNYGFKMETPPIHPGLFAAVANWQNGHQYKKDLLDAYKTQTFIILTRDKFGGRIKLDKNDQPLIHYHLHEYDKQHLIQGMQRAVELHYEMNAQKIHVFHNQALLFERGRDDINFFKNEILKRKWAPNYFSLFTAHQMGTCRMGGSARKHPLKPNGETREVKNLYVADASAFPSASGANPMLSIQALAYYISKNVVNSL